ncbi:hypothetical protein PIB30_046421 [Stylosanthes scabra]|uniref:Uncharacterized protein n=1 Tax=Stylosanthes scabra TaxID=79078 RepID=A0ABU6VHE5_9FABA|nr:hypothetical protein [Stylosanthes scabra]
MGSGIISYKYEKCKKFKDYNMRADAELGTRSAILRGNWRDGTPIEKKDANEEDSEEEQISSCSRFTKEANDRQFDGHNASSYDLLGVWQPPLPGKTVIDRRLEFAQSTVSKIGVLQFGIRAVRPYKAWGWTDYALLHTLCVCVLSPRALGYLCDTSMYECLQMSGRKRGNRRVTLASPTSNGGQPDLVNAYADIAAAIREFTAAIRESNAARDRERQHNGNGDHKGDDSTTGN